MAVVDYTAARTRVRANAAARRPGRGRLPAARGGPESRLRAPCPCPPSHCHACAGGVTMAVQIIGWILSVSFFGGTLIMILFCAGWIIMNPLPHPDSE